LQAELSVQTQTLQRTAETAQLEIGSLRSQLSARDREIEQLKSQLQTQTAAQKASETRASSDEANRLRSELNEATAELQRRAKSFSAEQQVPTVALCLNTVVGAFVLQSLLVVGSECGKFATNCYGTGAKDFTNKRC